MHSNKTVIITGASAGLGQELARLFAKDGWNCGLIARNKLALEALKQELDTPHNTILIESCDVSNKATLFKTIHSMIHSFGRIDCVIANAGIGIASPGQEANPDTLEKTILTNLIGAGNTAYAAIPTMIQQQFGQLVVISSLAGYRGLSEAGAYCASKAGVNALFESLRLDLKPFNIDVSIIRPGFIESNITNKNEYYMPQLLTTKDGVSRIYKAIQKRKKIHAFPKPLSLIAKSLYFWPCWLYDFLLSNVKNKKKQV